MAVGIEWSGLENIELSGLESIEWSDLEGIGSEYRYPAPAPAGPGATDMG